MPATGRDVLLARFHAALIKEEDLRARLRASAPHVSPNHDAQVWIEYLGALDATTQASHEYHQALNEVQHRNASPYTSVVRWPPGFSDIPPA